jgi:predicted MPP superfamily phosphohydrolase
VVADGTAGRRAEKTVMAGHVTGDTADDSAFDAALRGCRRGCRRKANRERECQDRYRRNPAENIFHSASSSIFFISLIHRPDFGSRTRSRALPSSGHPFKNDDPAAKASATLQGAA